MLIRAHNLTNAQQPPDRSPRARLGPSKSKLDGRNSSAKFKRVSEPPRSVRRLRRISSSTSIKAQLEHFSTIWRAFPTLKSRIAERESPAARGPNPAEGQRDHRVWPNRKCQSLVVCVIEVVFGKTLSESSLHRSCPLPERRGTAGFADCCSAH